MTPTTEVEDRGEVAQPAGPWSVGARAVRRGLIGAAYVLSLTYAGLPRDAIIDPNSNGWYAAIAPNILLGFLVGVYFGRAKFGLRLKLGVIGLMVGSLLGVIIGRLMDGPPDLKGPLFVAGGIIGGTLSIILGLALAIDTSQPPPPGRDRSPLWDREMDG